MNYSPEGRAKNLEVCRANAAAKRGVPTSPETRAKISEAKQGKPRDWTPEWREQNVALCKANAAAKRGIPLSPEMRAKLSAANAPQKNAAIEALRRGDRTIVGPTVEGAPSPCLLWTGPVNSSGYPGSRRHARVWELHHGPVPAGLTIDHLCGTRACLNVEHFTLTTQAENKARGGSPHFHLAA